MKKYFPILVIGCLLLVLGSSIASAAGLVPQCNPVAPVDSSDRCGLCDFLQLGKNLITFMIQISILLSAVFIVWGGFVIMTAGGSPERVSEGRKSITVAIIGVAIALGAWMIIGTVLNIITNSPSALPWTSIQCR